MGIFAEKKQLALALAAWGALWMAGMAQAGEPLPGCYTRIYDEAHLAGQPQQWVKGISVWIEYDWETEHAREGSIVVIPKGVTTQDGLLTAIMTCGSETRDPSWCKAWCDGGIVELLKADASGLTVKTHGLLVMQEGCRNGRDLAEVSGQPTQYRLKKVADTVCRP